MDEMVYNILCTYFDTLEYTGYLSDKDAHKVLILCFYKDFAFEDFRGNISEEDYHIIERALDCLYGTSCLIPYPDYLKMGKLQLGSMSEISRRLKHLEDTDVLKAVSPFDLENGSDILIYEGEALPQECP